MRPNHSLEATWDVPRFAIDGSNLISWSAGVGVAPAPQLEAVKPIIDNKEKNNDR